MDITELMVRILVEAVTIGNGVLSAWVELPANATGPLDPNATLTASGSDLVGYIASALVRASDIMCVAVDTLF